MLSFEDLIAFERKRDRQIAVSWQSAAPNTPADLVISAQQRLGLYGNEYKSLPAFLEDREVQISQEMKRILFYSDGWDNAEPGVRWLSRSEMRSPYSNIDAFVNQGTGESQIKRMRDSFESDGAENEIGDILDFLENSISIGKAQHEKIQYDLVLFAIPLTPDLPGAGFLAFDRMVPDREPFVFSPTGSFMSMWDYCLALIGDPRARVLE